MSVPMHTIRTFPSYEEARAAVERLLEEDLPTSAVTISGRRIRLVERLHSRGWLNAAGNGALNGATIGLLVGFFLGLFNLNAPGLSAFVLGFWGAIIGAIAGAVIGSLAHAFGRDSERHTTERSLGADHFDVRVVPEHVERARAILAGVEDESVGSAV